MRRHFSSSIKRMPNSTSKEGDKMSREKRKDLLLKCNVKRLQKTSKIVNRGPIMSNGEIRRNELLKARKYNLQRMLRRLIAQS